MRPGSFQDIIIRNIVAKQQKNIRKTAILIERCFPDMLFIASSLLQLSDSFPGKSLCQKCHSKH